MITWLGRTGNLVGDEGNSDGTYIPFVIHVGVIVAICVFHPAYPVATTTTTTTASSFYGAPAAMVLTFRLHLR